MFEVTNKILRDSGNQLTRDDISGGNALYCFDVEPNFIDQGPYLNLVKQGTCSLEAVFQNHYRRQHLAWCMQNTADTLKLILKKA